MVALSEILNLTAEPALFLVAVVALVASGTVYIRANGRYRQDEASLLRPVPVKSRSERR